jgi:hypothetical protein
MVENSAKDRQFHRSQPTNATEPQDPPLAVTFAATTDGVLNMPMPTTAPTTTALA